MYLNSDVNCIINQVLLIPKLINGYEARKSYKKKNLYNFLVFYWQLAIFRGLVVTNPSWLLTSRNLNLFIMLGLHLFFQNCTRQMTLRRLKIQWDGNSNLRGFTWWNWVISVHFFPFLSQCIPRWRKKVLMVMVVVLERFIAKKIGIMAEFQCQKIQLTSSYTMNR